VTLTVTRFSTGSVVKTAQTAADGFYSVGPLSQGAALNLSASKQEYTLLPPGASWPSGLAPGASQDFEARGPLPPGVTPGDPNAPPTAWSSSFNGPSNDVDTASRVAADNAGNVYVTGASNNTPGETADKDIVTVKYGPDGTLLWERACGTLGKWDGDNRLVMDGAGNVYVAMQSQTGADFDFTTVKYMPDGTRPWVHRLAGFSNDLVSDIALDGGGYLYLTGRSTVANQATDFLTMKLAAVASPNSPPTVSMTSPNEGSIFTVPASVTLTADAFDGDGTISVVGFYADTTLNGSPSREWIGEVTTPPYIIEFPNGAAGDYAITAVAIDDRGASTTSAPVHVTFIDSTAPADVV